MRVVSTYVPNGRALDDPAFVSKLAFLDTMRQRAATLAVAPSVIAGDVNVCPADLDVWDVSKVHGATHVTPDERRRLQAVLDAGYVDAFRHLHRDERGFTWWDYRAGHFHKGFGLHRPDHAFDAIGCQLRSSVVARAYRKPSKVPGTKPSDHAPLLVDVDD